MTRARYGLPKSRRLLKPTQFETTLKSNRPWRDVLFRVYATPNSYSYGRLGIVISRRVSPRAVERNRVKRCIRESFRHDQANLAGLDIVVVANPGAAGASVECLRTSLQKMWEMVEQQCKRF
ncbi:MAG TPA: ribonuclease P protein component [Candidatus Methylomirabilis sp.]|nr:ribonuclease P protein component [Candidatus Methylomirabilis sp.]